MDFSSLRGIELNSQPLPRSTQHHSVRPDWLYSASRCCPRVATFIVGPTPTYLLVPQMLPIKHTAHMLRVGSCNRTVYVFEDSPSQILCLRRLLPIFIAGCPAGLRNVGMSRARCQRMLASASQARSLFRSRSFVVRAISWANTDGLCLRQKQPWSLGHGLAAS